MGLCASEAGHDDGGDLCVLEGVMHFVLGKTSWSRKDPPCQGQG